MMTSKELDLTPEQKQLLYLLAVITDAEACPNTWVKETPLQAMILYGIQQGLFSDYDYAPISSPFFGKGRKFVNKSKEGEDDIGDLRELGLIETIRLSSTRHDFITGFRPTQKASKFLQSLSKKDKKKVDALFSCTSCDGGELELKIFVCLITQFKFFKTPFFPASTRPETYSCSIEHGHYLVNVKQAAFCKIQSVNMCIEQHVRRHAS